MSFSTGVILRLLGPLVQLICFALFLKWRGQGRSILGIAAEHWLYLGFGVGLAMVVLGLIISRPKQPRSSDDDGGQR